MSQPASNPEAAENNDQIQLTDRPLVVTLWALGIMPVDYFKAGYKTVFVFSRSESRELREKWKLGQPIPIDDVREIYKVEQSFNSAVHDD
jgi:hypothetical protein